VCFQFIHAKVKARGGTDATLKVVSLRAFLLIVYSLLVDDHPLIPRIVIGAFAVRGCCQEYIQKCGSPYCRCSHMPPPLPLPPPPPLPPARRGVYGCEAAIESSRTTAAAGLLSLGSACSSKPTASLEAIRSIMFVVEMPKEEG
jgi:hypothetical protein